MSGHDSYPEALSAAGRARRAEILTQVLAASASRRRRRVASKALFVVTPLLLVVAVVWDVQHQWSPVTTPNAVPAVASEPPPQTAVRIVSTDPSLVTRWSAPKGSFAVTRLDDSELFALLSGEGRATGMVRAGDTVTVVGLDTDNEAKPSGRAPAAPPLIYAGVYRDAERSPALGYWRASV